MKNNFSSVKKIPAQFLQVKHKRCQKILFKNKSTGRKIIKPLKTQFVALIKSVIEYAFVAMGQLGKKIYNIFWASYDLSKGSFEAGSKSILQNIFVPYVCMP